jgi:ABC-type transport system substrate-binding protein
MNNDPSHRVQAVIRGDADLTLETASSDITQLRSRFASQLRLDAQPDTSFLTFNVRRPPFSNVLARRAVNLAIDRSAVASRLGGPGLSIPTCQVLPPHFPETMTTVRGPGRHSTDAGTDRTSPAPGRLCVPREPQERPSTSSAPETTQSLPRQPTRWSPLCARSATGRE